MSKLCELCQFIGTRCYGRFINERRTTTGVVGRTGFVGPGSSNNGLVVWWLLVIFSLFLSVSDACSARSTPKPNKPAPPALVVTSGPTARPNITFHTYACPPMHASWYCLNGATCFTVKIGEHTLYNCECAEGYMGPRCEFKDLDSSYLLSRKQVLLETASIAFGATLAILLVVIVCASLYIRYSRLQKQNQQLTVTTYVDNSDANNNNNNNDTHRKPFARRSPASPLPIVTHHHHHHHHYDTKSSPSTTRRSSFSTPTTAPFTSTTAIDVEKSPIDNFFSSAAVNDSLLNDDVEMNRDCGDMLFRYHSEQQQQKQQNRQSHCFLMQQQMPPILIMINPQRDLISTKKSPIHPSIQIEIEV